MNSIESFRLSETAKELGDKIARLNFQFETFVKLGLSPEDQKLRDLIALSMIRNIDGMADDARELANETESAYEPEK